MASVLFLYTLDESMNFPLIAALSIGVLALLKFPSYVVNPVVERIARAIAFAEGFYKAGSLPQRAHNPGSLMLGDQGFGMIDGKTIFPTDLAGWSALYRQVEMMLSGTSKFYNAGMTILEVARIYTGGDSPETWAVNVSKNLGVSTQTQLVDIRG